MKILILGAGKMVDALLQGIGQDNNEYFIYSPSGSSAKKLAEKYHAKNVDNQLIPDPDLIILGHKPQQLSQVARELNGRFHNIPFISMLAALDEEAQINILKIKKLLRIMPNLNVRFNRGVTLICSNSFDDEKKSQIKDWLKPTGVCLEVNEEQLNELTLLTGCGPAIFYQFAIVLAQCFKTIPYQEALRLTQQVFQGSGTLLENYSGNFESAIQDVASKGGVTEAIIKALHESGFEEKIELSIEAGKVRSKELKDAIHRN